MNTLLIHDSNLLLARKCQESMNRLGIKIDVCDIETNCIEHIYQHSYSLLFLDGGIGKAKLTTLVQNLKKAFIKTRIVFFYEGDEQKKYFLEASKDFYEIFYVRFPFFFDELAMLIGRLQLSPHYLDKESVLNIGELVLDANRRNVSRKRRPIYLRNKEFNLLKFLMQNCNRVLSRTQILDFVWDCNANIFTNTVDVHINNLRRKLGRDYGNSLIKTVHGVGYMLCDETNAIDK